MAFALRQPMARRRRAAADDTAAADDGTVARPSRSRVAAARGAWAVGSGLLLVARIVRLIAWLVALVIGAAILLKVLGANGSNTIVKDIHDVAKFLVGPFDHMFSIRNAKVAIAVNWGIASIVYLAVGSFIAGLIARAAPRGIPPGRAVD